jgi:subtilisin family serine protease
MLPQPLRPVAFSLAHLEGARGPVVTRGDSLLRRARQRLLLMLDPVKAAEAVAAAKVTPGVEYAELIPVQTLPEFGSLPQPAEEPRPPSQPGSQGIPPGVLGDWGPTYVKRPSVWANLEVDGIAVVDSGRYPHPNVSHVIQAPGFHTDDEVGHGTAVCSVLCGRAIKWLDFSPNSADTSRDLLDGLLPKAKVTCYNVFGWSNQFSRYIVKPGKYSLALNEIAQKGFRVVNLSIGAPNPIGSSITEKKDFETLETAGVLAVAGSGNHSKTANEADENLVKTINFPAAQPTVLPVGAITSSGKWWKLSNSTPPSSSNKTVDIAAPGYNILAAWLPPVKFSLWMYGTSFAAPYVTAAAAVYRNLISEDETPGEVRASLLNFVDALPQNSPGARGLDCSSLVPPEGE